MNGISTSIAWLIVVTGRPAAGKTTLARWLGKQLSFPVFSKDSVKEVLFNELGWRDREWSKMLGRASVELLYHLAQTQLEVGKSVILDNAFHPRLASPKLRLLGEQYRVHTLQIICNTDSETLFQRFKQRAETGTRHDGHVDMQSLNELKVNLQQERPLQLDVDGPVMEIDTTDLAALRYEDILKQVKLFLEGIG